jgi:hypothetical protein
MEKYNRYSCLIALFSLRGKINDKAFSDLSARMSRENVLLRDAVATMSENGAKGTLRGAQRTIRDIWKNAEAALKDEADQGSEPQQLSPAARLRLIIAQCDIAEINLKTIAKDFAPDVSQEIEAAATPGAMAAPGEEHQANTISGTPGAMKEPGAPIPGNDEPTNSTNQATPTRTKRGKGRPKAAAALDSYICDPKKADSVTAKIKSLAKDKSPIDAHAIIAAAIELKLIDRPPYKAAAATLGDAVGSSKNPYNNRIPTPGRTTAQTLGDAAAATFAAKVEQYKEQFKDI